MVTLTRFDEVTALDVAEQRRLLRTGAPEQQVWAAWALGLELGERAVPELCIALDRNEDAGVRRHLLVILAGLGERALLDEMSTREVDEAVRATAAQYAFQTGEPCLSPTRRGTRSSTPMTSPPWWPTQMRRCGSWP